MTQQTQSLLDHFFRYEYGKLVSLLTSKFTHQHIDLVEDAVQEALSKATRIWPYNEIPGNPFGWLYKVANNYIIDQLRRNARLTEIAYAEIAFGNQYYNPDIESLDDQLSDDLLNMIFACCHPEILLRDRLLLSLKLLCGFSSAEIASALLKKEAAVKKGLVRAKQRFKTNIKIKKPTKQELDYRLSDVLKVIYLLFNEGYKATDGDQLVKKDICDDAIRLAIIIHESDYENHPVLNALLSLMYFKASRFETRINDSGELVTLEHQDRSKWDKNYLEKAFEHLSKSSQGNEFSTYHLEAGIESHYCSVSSYSETDWSYILYLYDLMLETEYSDVVALNRIVALEKVKGAGIAYKELERLNESPAMTNNHIFYAIKADVCRNLGKTEEAKDALKDAIKHANNQVEKVFLLKKVNESDY